MKQNNLSGIERKLSHLGITDKIAQLPLSELNSLSLEIHRRKSKQVRPSDLDPFTVMEMKLKILKLATAGGFIAHELSPLVPFGCCAAIAPVDQNNVVSATRGVEVISDITNALTLEACMQRKRDVANLAELCASERVVRAQSFDNPKFSPPFSIVCNA